MILQISQCSRPLSFPRKLMELTSALSGPSTSEESSLHHNLIALLKPATIRCVGANGGP